METSSLLFPAINTADGSPNPASALSPRVRLEEDALQTPLNAWPGGADQSSLSSASRLMHSVASGALRPPHWVNSEYQLHPGSPDTESNLKEAQTVMEAYSATLQTYGGDLEDNPEAQAMFQRALTIARSRRSAASTYNRNALMKDDT